MKLPRLFSLLAILSVIGLITLHAQSEPSAPPNQTQAQKTVPRTTQASPLEFTNPPAQLQLQPEPSALPAKGRPAPVLDALPAFPDLQRPNTLDSNGLILPVEPDFAEFKLVRRGNPILVPEGPNPTEDAAVELKTRARFREVKASALKAPEVQAALLEAQNARSDRALKDALRRHYSLLFARMRAADHSLSSLIALREKEAMAPLTEKINR